MSNLDKLKEMLAIQGDDGNWNYDPYMHGVYNGMAFAIACLEDREPEYRDAPEKWLCDDLTETNLVDNTERSDT